MTGQAARALVAANLEQAIKSKGRKPGELALALWPTSSAVGREQRLRRARAGQVATLDTLAELADELGIELQALFAPRDGHSYQQDVYCKEEDVRPSKP